MEALRKFLAQQPLTAEWKEFEVINLVFWEIEQALRLFGGQATPEVMLAVDAINRWMLAEIGRIRG